MSNFKYFKKELQNHFQTMIKDNSGLFRVDANPYKLYDLYLASFPEGTNDIFRERRFHDCSCCKSFVKSMGNVVTIKNGQMISLWDFKSEFPEYQPVVKALSKFIHSKSINSIFLTETKNIGTDSNFDDIQIDPPLQWHHLYLEIPESYVYKYNGNTMSSVIGDANTKRIVLENTLKEISLEAVEIVEELIAQESLHRGNEFEHIINGLKEVIEIYNESNKDDLFFWDYSRKVKTEIAHAKNTAIGTLLIDITNDIDLMEAVSKYENKVAGENFKRPKEIFTRKQVEEADAKITALGLKSALGRRFATIGDITINNILFVDRETKSKLVEQDPLAVMYDKSFTKEINPKHFDRIPEISIKDFIANILPKTQKMELYFENKYMNNLMSLIAPKDINAGKLFKWNNNFSWAYAGNLADSSMKERVKLAGGKVDGVLRFSIQWNDITPSMNDLDAHCIQPNGVHLYWSNKLDYETKGNLDIDIRNPVPNIPSVENITWPDKSKMKQGSYTFYVHNYAHRGGNDGFRAEIEFDGQIFEFDYPHNIKQDEKVEVARVTLKENGEFEILPKLEFSYSAKRLWNVKTNSFLPVELVMYSPNYWDEQDGIGHKQYFFIIKDMINPETPNGFYNEFLRNDLITNKRAFAALGSYMKVAESNDQLSGLGFSSTKPNHLIVRTTSENLTSLIKIKF